MQTWDWVVFGALGLLALAQVRQRNAALHGQKRLRAELDALSQRQDCMDARQDRLQRMVTDRGWKDSFDLTRIHWERPGPF